jgi:hypothetical protein
VSAQDVVERAVLTTDDDAIEQRWGVDLADDGVDWDEPEHPVDRARSSSSPTRLIAAVAGEEREGSRRLGQATGAARRASTVTPTS